MTERSRLGVLDGLRGLMCLWVLIGHTCAFTGMNSVPILRSPHYAVDGFMLLSGFLMAFHYILRQAREPWTCRTTWILFYIRRFFRISPLYYAFLLPTYLFLDRYDAWRGALHRAFLPSSPLPEMPPLSSGHVLSHLSFLFGVWPKYHTSLVIPDWSLSLEMQFYLAFPFLMLFAMRFGWTAFSLAASAVYVLAKSTILTHYFSQPSPLPLSLLWFVIGMVWAQAYIDLHSGRKSTLRFAIFAASLSLLSRDPHDIILVGIFCWLLFAEHRLAGGQCAGYVRTALSGKVSSFLAGASYSVYLLHLLILTPIAYFLYTLTNLGPGVRFAIALGITASLSYAMAKPLEIVENLGISWGKRLSRAIASAPSAQLTYNTSGSRATGLHIESLGSPLSPQRATE